MAWLMKKHNKQCGARSNDSPPFSKLFCNFYSFHQSSRAETRKSAIFISLAAAIHDVSWCIHVPSQTWQWRLILRDVVKHESVAVVVNLMKEQALNPHWLDASTGWSRFLPLMGHGSWTGCLFMVVSSCKVSHMFHWALALQWFEEPLISFNFI